MGIIQQQTIKGTFYSYLGIAIGFFSFYLIQPHAITPEQVGLISILTTYSLMFAQFAMLGFNGTTRYFPYFRDEEKKHHGYLFLSCAISAVGMLLFTCLAYYFKAEIISEKSQKTPLFSEYYWYLIPLTLFTLFFNVFNLYARMLYNVISGTILNEFFKRIFILVPLLLIYFRLISFNWFMVLWLVANIIPTLLLAIRLVRDKQFFVKPDFKFLDKELTRKLISISVFAILTGSSPLIVQNLDTYFVNKRYGLNSTGVYNIAFYFATVIAIPARSLYNIAFTIVADAWKQNDLENIKSIYKKSCLTQLVSSLFIFIMIWANVDNIFHLLPAVYQGGKYVIFFVSMGYLIDSATGINGIIVGTSKYYRLDSLFYVLLIGVTVTANIILVPIYGITGAAIASAITLLVFNLFRYLFILFAFKMQPFNYKSPLTIALAAAIYYLTILVIPKGLNFILDTALRSILISVLYGLCVYFFNLSQDITYLMDKYLIKFKLKT